MAQDKFVEKLYTKDGRTRAASTAVREVELQNAGWKPVQKRSEAPADGGAAPKK